MTRHATSTVRPVVDISGTLAALEAKVDRLTALVEQMVHPCRSGPGSLSKRPLL